MKPVAATSVLTIAGESFGSALMAGSAGYPNRQIMLDALAASGAGRLADRGLGQWTTGIALSF